MYNHIRKLKRFSEDQTRFILAQVALAIGQLHNNHILYRDLKPDNILMDVDGYIAIADFGLSKIIDPSQRTNTLAGTAEYMSPEVIEGKTHNKQADWWSFGVILYEMIFGFPPFFHRNKHFLFDMIIHKDLKFPSPEKTDVTISNDAKELIVRLLQKSPEMRLGNDKDADEILAHPFFKTIDKEKLMNKQLPAVYMPKFNETDKYDFPYVDPEAEKAKVEIEVKGEAAMRLIKLHEVISYSINY